MALVWLVENEYDHEQLRLSIGSQYNFQNTSQLTALLRSHFWFLLRSLIMTRAAVHDGSLLLSQCWWRRCCPRHTALACHQYFHQFLNWPTHNPHDQDTLTHRYKHLGPGTRDVSLLQLEVPTGHQPYRVCTSTLRRCERTASAPADHKSLVRGSAASKRVSRPHWRPC